MKKGSMQLGINAIVVLIIALAILGLAMSFVTSLFKGGEEKLGSLIGRTELPIHADATEPLRFERSDITIKSGKSTALKVSVYNNNFQSDEDIYIDLVGCTDAEGDSESGITLSSLSQKIPLGTDGGYGVIISIDDEVDPGTYICSVEAVGDTSGNFVSEQLFITVIV